MIVLIPAFEPGPALPALIGELAILDPASRVLVIDDGSGPAYDAVFSCAAANGATVLRHARNLGKGAAIKTGLRHVLDTHPADVVTADADGQHTANDIVRIGEELARSHVCAAPPMILGCRNFSGTVPFRSRFGNALARGVFRVAAGWRLSDTQTGLRGLPREMLVWLSEQPGDRFEYEQTVLLRSRQAGWSVREAPIRTVYLDGNASSHFRPLVDSARVALPLILFAASSFAAFLVDALLMLVLAAVTGQLILSIVLARIASASVNFALNRRIVFRGATRPRAKNAARYALLAVLLLASNIVWMSTLTSFGVPLAVAKIATEIVMFVLSYAIQKNFVFGARSLVHPPQPPHSSGIAPSSDMADTSITGRSS